MSDGEVIDAILKGYKVHHKPSNVVNITFTAGLLSVQELDNKKQFLSSTMWMIFSWYDHRVVWNASLSSEKSILADSNKFWKPELIIANGIKGQELLHNGGSLVVTSHGNIRWLLTGAMETKCPINIYKFPFDTQTCEIEVGGWFGDLNKISISRETGLNMKQFKENSEFEIYVDDIADIHRSYSTNIFRVTIHLKRRPLFYIFTILLPMLLLYFLNSFVFLLPSQSGEKTSAAVSVLLSFQLFLSIIRDSLPENSLTVSLFSLYVSLVNFTSVVIVVVNILLFKMKESLPPKWVLGMYKKDIRKVDVEMGNVEDEEQGRPKWEDIEPKLNKACFLFFFVFSCGATSAMLGMLTML
ncbi:acetylcholine receptor subunit delta-like [Haliotis rubra]|uniref:acetylcholine receptor subunit delta-like n=1 Tax=Haliotis rubra TaxID=36100 RepID=UPI001EE5CF87|nr:acetylcholine receptor subunit delta-like [Haliotis rubra]